MLELKNYTYVYPNGKVGAKDVTLKIEAGDIFAFIGHNGAGKTTTIKSIVGINGITDGDILIQGKSIKENPIESKKIIAYIPDNPDIYQALTGIQYLNLIADIFKVDKDTRKSIIEKYATELGLINDLGTPIASYSHGMKQKLVLISAFVHSPKLIIMDEPFVGLDPKASFIVKSVMQEFVKNGGAIFFSTHVLDVAEKLCNKVAIINKGEVVLSGTMNEVKKSKSLEQTFLGVIDE